MELEYFPDIEHVRNSILKLKEIGFPKYDGETNVESFITRIENILSLEFGLLMHLVLPFKQKEFPLKFFRARACDTFQNIDIIREHSYPPLNLTKMGRCNFPQYPVFYCSNDGMTALMEVKRNGGEMEKKICISKWEINPTDDELIFQNFLQSPLPQNNPFYFLQKDIQARISEPFEKKYNTKLSRAQKEGLIECLRFLDSCFISDDNYSLSASLAHRGLYANHNYRADILMYPSVQTNFKGVNLALNPNFVENNLKLTRLYEVSLENYNPKSGKMNVTFYRYAKIEKNVIWWYNLSPDNIDYEQGLLEDFGHLMKNKSLKNTFNLI